MGQKARQALEAGMTLDHWVQRVSKVVVDAVAARAA
jgi:hypothetical protein